MGVYQSATEPRVRRRAWTQKISRAYYNAFNERKLADQIRDRKHIPRSVVPVMVYSDPDHVLFTFTWYEVEIPD